MAHPTWEQQPGTDGLVTVCCRVYETKPYRFLNTSVEAAPFRFPIYLFTAHFFVKPAVQDWGSSARGRFEHTWGTHCRPGEMQRGWGIPCVRPPPCCQHLPPCPASCSVCQASGSDLPLHQIRLLSRACGPVFGSRRWRDTFGVLSLKLEDSMTSTTRKGMPDTAKALQMSLASLVWAPCPWRMVLQQFELSFQQPTFSFSLPLLGSLS